MPVTRPPRLLIDALDREQVARARAMRPEDRLLEGPRLFDRACRLMRDGLRHQCPLATEERVNALLHERLALLDRLNRR